MGNTDSKLNFRKAVVQLTSKSQVRHENIELFWFEFLKKLKYRLEEHRRER